MTNKNYKLSFWRKNEIIEEHAIKAYSLDEAKQIARIMKDKFLDRSKVKFQLRYITNKKYVKGDY